MPTTFLYRVRDKAGQTVEGELEAENATLVAGKLRSMGYTPVSIEKRSNASLTSELKIPGLSGRMKLKDVAVFSRQFATMINSGLSLLRSLAILGQMDHGQARDLFKVETYPTLHAMVSTVTAKKRKDAGVADILRALFPCGSVTGAPKIRAMQILRELESSPRGAYCGAIGHFSPDGSARFNVAIRTLTVWRGGGHEDRLGLRHQREPGLIDALHK